jgi:hypothetical protein
MNISPRLRAIIHILIPFNPECTEKVKDGSVSANTVTLSHPPYCNFV